MTYDFVHRALQFYKARFTLSYNIPILVYEVTGYDL